MKKAIYFSVFIGLTGCTMNKLFLNPTPLDRATKETKIYDYRNEKNLFVQLGDHFQPNFYDSLGIKQTIDFNIESVEFANRKGHLINGWFMSPKENSNDITIYYLHGNSGSIYYQFGLMVPFVERGYTVFMIDYSGFGYSEGKAKIKNVYTDAEDGLAYLKTKTKYLGNILIVYGQSLGGHLTAAISNEFQNDADAFVMEGSFASHDEVAAQTSGLGWFAKMMTRERYSGLDTIPMVTKPKLFIHSSEDSRVPYVNSQMLFKAAHEPKEFYSITGRHVFGPLLFADSISAKMLKMVK